MDKKYITELLRKVETETLNPDERLILMEWINAKDSRLTDFTQYKAEDWIKFQSNILTNDKKTKPRKSIVRQIIRFGSVAACLLLSLFAGKHMFFSNEARTEYITESESKRIVLPDGSTVILGLNSHFYWDDHFNVMNRKVHLNGLAFFEVAPNAEKPFIIKTSSTTTEVLGTSFYLSDYKNEHHASLQVIEGRVQFDGDDTASLVQEAGSHIRYDKVNKIILPITLGIQDYYQLNKELVFRDTPLKEVIATLEKCYAVQIKIEGDISNCTFSSKFKEKTIDYILNILAITYNSQLHSSNKSNYLLEKINCQ